MTVLEQQAYEIALKFATQLSYKYRLDRDEAVSEAYAAVCSRLGKFSEERGQIGAFVYVVVNRALIAFSKKTMNQAKRFTPTSGQLEVFCTVNDTDEDELITMALELASTGMQPRTVRSMLKKALAARGIPKSRIAEMFASVENSLYVTRKAYACHADE